MCFVSGFAYFAKHQGGGLQPPGGIYRELEDSPKNVEKVVNKCINAFHKDYIWDLVWPWCFIGIERLDNLPDP